jgi:DNA-binding PadR family transcriptional regulator
MMQVSLQTLQLLQVFMEDPSRARYGLELAKRTGLKSGTVYPALGRLEQEGWLTSEVEDVDPKLAKRPARRIYTLTNAGMAGATQAARRYRAALPLALEERFA